MFDRLFVRPEALAHHRAEPLLEERLTFLAHLADQGLARSSLRAIAAELLVIMKSLGLASRPGEAISRDEIQQKVVHKFSGVAQRWLRFLGRLRQPPAPVSPYAKKIKAFADDMEHERGLSPATIRTRCWVVSRFLSRWDAADGSLRGMTPQCIDSVLQKMLRSGVYSRVTIQDWAYALRAFFRYAEVRGWCRKGLAASIRGPRVFAQTSLPLGPSWEEVRQLLAMTEGDRRVDIRARAILMLLAIYGLRAGEVNRLRLDDFDWERELFTVASSKVRRSRTYPLTRSVGDAILRYLQEVRPRSSHRTLFLTLHPPFRPLHQSPWGLVGKRLQSINASLPHYGPHALRHACAARLLAQGLSLKEIGDHLGHVDPDTTRIYAKVDLVGLCQVADFDWGGLL